MEIESIKIEDLKPYENNPRHNDEAVEGVKESIRLFGFKIPIVIDKNNVIVSAAEDGGSPVAIGFRAKKANGKYRYFWLYRVVFGIPATNLATKGDSITFSTPTIEGTVLRRNKADSRGKHPWKAEVTEGESTSTTTITNWYKEVYEPTYTTSGTGGSN